MNKIIKSLKKNYIGIMFLFISSFLTSVGQLFWKLSHEGFFIFLIVGFLCYGVGAVLMIIGFKFGSFSVLHPMMCFGYIFAIIFGILILKENISALKIFGILFIVIGVVSIGGGDE